MVFTNRNLFRIVFAAAAGSLFTIAFFISQKSASAEPAAMVNPKKITRDLDQKDDALALEEAELMESMTRVKKKEAAPKAAKENARASIDLKKVADTIALSEPPEKTKIEKLTARKEEAAVEHTEPVASTVERAVEKSKEPTKKESIARAARPEPAASELEKSVEKSIEPRREQPPLKEAAARTITQSDPALRKEVAALGGLFNQWHKEFDQKYASVLNTQTEISKALNERIDLIEKRDRLAPDTGVNAEALAAMRSELIGKQEAAESRIAALEKRKAAAAPVTLFRRPKSVRG